MRILALLIIVLILATAFGGYFVYYESTHTSQSTSNVATLPYTTDANYSYVAQLAPNILYNTTSISNGQGTLFSNLTKSINVTFLYSVSTENTSKIALACTYSEFLVTSSWNKTLLQGSVKSQKDATTQASISENFSVDVAEISNLIQTIQSETGVTNSNYAVEFVPSVTGAISSNGVTGNFLADPTFNFTFSSAFGSRGGVITPSNPTIKSSGRILGSSGAPADSLLNVMYYISFITLGGSAAALVVTGFFYSKSSKRPVTRQSLLERKLAQYQEIISATDTPPNRRRAISIISLEDLVKIADTMGKPVLRFVDKEKSTSSNQFYVMDGETCYLFAPPDSQ